MTEIFSGLICRPPRKQYTEDDLGPAVYLLQDQMCVRKDTELKTKSKMKIKCSRLSVSLGAMIYFNFAVFGSFGIGSKIEIEQRSDRGVKRSTDQEIERHMSKLKM